ncbi:hypothetical protein HUT16_27945 [Kitasatospora sp. NA04385]|uniref:hypothetical protein n=1 Tax=Kitasatospora sp. NA04385 TaxID=2742135 RepID=UPI001164486F|nr:hypothetical protein [Kitasatospora sp. NA04385]QDJ74270.1 DsrE/DsrF-like family protein [Kitasatospora sp.]QKW22403.1 hypothetical protein HUT16_27945 [Kitasatospora sp. NA04385]
MARRQVPPTDVLITLMGAPHQSDLATSVLRLVQALLERGGRVQVWACGYATMLTEEALGEYKPRDLSDLSARHPTTAALVRAMLDEFPDRLFWYGCRFCSDDRGATHVPEVVMRAPHAFAANLAAAGKTVMIGVI